MIAKASRYNHQKVVLEIDFSGVLFGYTELTILPGTKDLKTIYLHSRQCNITLVQVGGYTVSDWACYDPLTTLVSSNISDCHDHPEVKRKLYSAYAESDEGELAIPIPRQVSVKCASNGKSKAVRETATPEPQSQQQATAAGSEFAPIQVRIYYNLRNPVEGFQFILPSDAYPYRVPHAYTTPSSPDSARCWVPCLDNLWEKCTWELEFVVPKTLEDTASAADADADESGGTPTIVVCSGELVEKIAHPNNANKVIYLFSQPSLTSVQHIAFAAGPFVVYPIPTEVAGLTDDSAGSQALMHAFCLPGSDPMLSNTVSFLRTAMNFYSTECGSYPFGSYKLVFVDELPTQRFDSAALTLVSTDLLHGEDAIDQVFETRQVLLYGLACQWVGVNIIQKTWSDTWLVNGLGLYIAGLCLKKIMGNNEYRFRLKKDMERVIELDDGFMPPICQPGNVEPPDPSTLAFINLKGPLVLHILDRKLGKTGTSLGLSRVLPKIFLSAISGEMTQNCLSTHAFLRTCRKVSGADLRSFVEQWIHGSGCPQFSFLATFNRKRMAIEIQMRQECPAHILRKDEPMTAALLKPVPFFEGQMTVRIHEADGTPYEHVLDILTPVRRFEVPFNTKYKRVRRNTKRYLARQAAAQAAAEGDAEAAEAMGLVDMSFGLDIWEDQVERERWQVADWTEEEEAVMAGATYEWIRMDADFEWIAKIQFEQPDYMWVSQLQRDRDVVAQYEAVHALARQPTNIVSSTLTKTILVSNYFFRVRCEAARVLVSCANRTLDFIGLFHLFKLFLRYCYEPEGDVNVFFHKFVPRPNDFSDFAEYFVRKALISAISQVRFDTGKTPPQIRQFLIDQLRYNDNTSNPFSDAYYIATLISALACVTVSTATPEHGELTRTESKLDQNEEDIELLKAAIGEVERYRSMDRLIPSVHNVVTVSALEFHSTLAMANLIPNDPKIFLTSTREGNATQVRLAGFDGLFLTKWYTPKIMRYIFSVVANDSSRVVRRHVARNMCESLALLATVGEIKPEQKEEKLLIEEDGTKPDKVKEQKKTETDLMLRALRKDKEVGKSEVLRECVMPIALDPRADCEVRWSMLKLADLAVRGTDEKPPKVTIHLPPTPTVEVPPAIGSPILPSIKLGAKPSKPQIKITAGRKPSILPSPIASTSTTKLRLTQPGTPKTSTADVPQPEFKVPAPPPPKVAVSKKKEKHVAKAQTNGMPTPDLKACRVVLKRLNGCKHAIIFAQPVDPVRDQAADYYNVIKHPMDLSTMGVKLENGVYKNREGFLADFRLMIQNCKTYNHPETYAHGEATALEAFFDKVWTKCVATIDSKAAAKQEPEPEPVPIAPPVPKVRVAAPATEEKKPSVKITHAPTPVPEASAAPKLKLKLGGSRPPESATTATPSGSEPPAAAPKRQPKKKARLADMPPPPYVDDGSHDLLQEVIAIEELGKSPQKPPKQKRKIIELDADEELLSLATESPDPGSTRQVEPESSAQPVAAVAPPAPVPKKSQQNQPKTRKIVEKPAESPRPLPPAHHHKGKERESVPPPPASEPSHSVVKPKKASSLAPTESTPINEKKCREVLKNLVKLPQSFLFSRPVDPIGDGCPTYYEEITHPMDFATMKTKLDSSQYFTMEEFAKDVMLIFSNCRKFNPPTTDPTVCADIVEKAFKKEWVKAMEKKLSASEKRSIVAVMNKLQNDNNWLVFLHPVDPVALGILDYHEVIPKRDARDLLTIRHKLDGDKYDSLEAWEADMELMTNNAVKYNGAESLVGQVAFALQAKVREESTRLRGMNQQNRKRPNTVDAKTPPVQPSLKKQKIK